MRRETDGSFTPVGTTAGEMGVDVSLAGLLLGEGIGAVAGS